MMSLSKKLVLFVSCLVLLTSLVNLTVVYVQNKKMMIAGGEQDALMIVKTFESAIGDRADEQDLQKALNQLKASDLKIRCDRL